MPLARIEVEQLGHDRWHAELEVGSPMCRRAVINKATFADTIAAIVDAYLGFMPPAPKVAKDEEWRHPEPAERRNRGR